MSTNVLKTTMKEAHRSFISVLIDSTMVVGVKWKSRYCIDIYHVADAASWLWLENAQVSSCFDYEDAVCCNQCVTVEKRYTIVNGSMVCRRSRKMKRTAQIAPSKDA